jgi:hypothetical protein
MKANKSPYESTGQDVYHPDGTHLLGLDGIFHTGCVDRAQTRQPCLSCNNCIHIVSGNMRQARFETTFRLALTTC